MTVRDDMARFGWPVPIMAISGNGYHLLYRIDLPTNDDGLIERVLLALCERYSDDSVTVDRAVHNPSRITKVIGTLARKGDDTPDRPHRRSELLEIPNA